MATDKEAGVHVGGLPHRMPQGLWKAAESSIYLVASQQGREVLEKHFPELLGMIHQTKLASVVQRSKDMLEQSLSRISSGRKPVIISRTEEIKEVLRDFHRELPISLELPPEGIGTVIQNIGRADITNMLRGSRTALIDPEGKPIIVARSAEESSPIRNSLLELIRNYSQFVKYLSDDHGIHLPPTHNFSVLKSEAPSNPLEAFIHFGSLGSFTTRSRPQINLPMFAYLHGDDKLMQTYMQTLPPYYSGHPMFRAGQLATT